MDDLVAVLVIVMIAGAAIAICQFLLVVALIVIAVFTIILLPLLIRGFIREVLSPSKEKDH